MGPLWQHVEMTRRPLTASGRPKHRLLRLAAIEHVGTPGVESATARRVDRARHVTPQNYRVANGSGLRNRHSRQQGLGIGMFRRGKDLLPWRHLDDLAEIHH